MAEAAEVLGALVKLQKIDTFIHNLNVEKEAISKQILLKNAEFENAKLGFDEKKKATDDLKKQKAGIELEIKQKDVDVKAKEANSHMVKTNDQFKLMQLEVERDKQVKRKLEDDEIIIMEKEEVGIKVMKEAEKDYKEKEILIKNQIKALETEISLKDSAIAGEAANRAAAIEGVKKIDKVIIDRYEKILKNRNGLAVAELIKNEKGSVSCGGCKLTVRAQAMIEVRKKDKIYSCDNCARIWVVTETEQE
ncbi:MAG: C4-type zinc ribbon domain-containing protein [bacterium]